MRIFISTGEVSGDLQGAMLVESLIRQAQTKGIELEIVALGGERMASSGATVLGNTTAIGSMGVLEALPFVLPTWQIQRLAKQYIKQHPPDVIVLIDYHGPNLALGSYARQHLPSVPIVYYIGPQEWVWSPLEQNTKQMAKITDKLLAIFPAEAAYYQSKGICVTWVGHPLLDRIQTACSRDEAREKLGLTADELVVVLLPASRKQELKYLLPIMCQGAKLLQRKLPQVRFLLPVSLKTYEDGIASMLKEYDLTATILSGQTLEAIAAADVAITKSGTVNLEIALLGVPQVVIYRLSALTIWVARKFFKFSIPFMSPVNLVVNRGIVPELFQEQVTPVAICEEALELLLNLQKREQIAQDYQEMRSCLGEVGVCDRAAGEILAIKTLLPVQ